MKTKQIRKAKTNVLTALCVAVSAKYKDEGDEVKAGVVVSCLSYDPPRFYASVARYPDGPMRKTIVCQVGKFGHEVIETADAAVALLAQKWAQENSPPPVKESIDRLNDVLGSL